MLIGVSLLIDKNNNTYDNIYFAFYNDNEKIDTMPLKDNSDGLIFSHGECDNGASIIWNIGTWTNPELLSNEFYEKERGVKVYNANNMLFPAEWNKGTDVGNKFNGIGLMYPSDYGYAVGGTVREICLNTNLNIFDQEKCKDNTWLFNKKYNWFLSSNSSTYMSVFNSYSTGAVGSYDVYHARVVWPTIYLKTSVKILSNFHPELEYGTVSNPFLLGIA